MVRNEMKSATASSRRALVEDLDECSEESEVNDRMDSMSDFSTMSVGLNGGGARKELFAVSSPVLC